MNVTLATLLALNLPVAISCAMATYQGLFGLAAPEPNPARWLAIASPILLACWLAGAAMLRVRAPGVALLLTGAPPMLLAAYVFYALNFAP